MKAPVLKSENIALRPIILADANTFISWFKDKKVVLHLLIQKSLPLNEQKKWIKNMLADKNKIVWGIYSKDGKLIGNTQLDFKRDHKVASFGIVIGEKEYWGKGYAVEVLELLKKYVFERLKYVRLQLVYHVTNLAAKRAYEKAGFTVEGIIRKSHYNKVTKQFEDKIIMSILDTEYYKNK